MTHTIAVFISSSTTELANAFYAAQGMIFDRGLDGETFFFELREKPSMLIRLEAAGYFKPEEKPVWDMHSITEHGVTLYLCNMEAGDGYFYIPFSNILAVHTVSDGWLQDVRKCNAIRIP
ncbi:hypothetical protein JHS3_24090 [Jeongeupia sp. HS-3]|uniref:hypothetical protein n=1 Tax=Jeongeupia sp. HS-3 TaxID=1009682 RepID=UPI0018A342C4|nr:hypothetical protein [Jeongeupia sp. HS-3]BCL76673.1 hypothetical protein JHS3_24090 [Jeongeupia sp. HS-3]